MAHRANWRGPTQNTDGSVFDQSQFRGFELELDGQPAVSVPLGWDTDNQYEFDLRTLQGFSFGDHRLRMRTVNNRGAASDWTAPVSFVHNDERVPMPPLDLAVA